MTDRTTIGVIGCDSFHKITFTLGGDGKMNSVDFDVPILAWAERPWHVVQESVLATCAHMLSALRSGRDAAPSANDTNVCSLRGCI